MKYVDDLWPDDPYGADLMPWWMKFKLVQAVCAVFATGVALAVWAMVAAAVVGSLLLIAGVVYAIVA